MAALSTRFQRRKEPACWGPDDLAITGATLGNPPFRELVEAASEGGFSGLSLWPRRDLPAGQG